VGTYNLRETCKLYLSVGEEKNIAATPCQPICVVGGTWM